MGVPLTFVIMILQQDSLILLLSVSVQLLKRLCILALLVTFLSPALSPGSSPTQAMAWKGKILQEEPLIYCGIKITNCNPFVMLRMPSPTLSLSQKKHCSPKCDCACFYPAAAPCICVVSAMRFVCSYLHPKWFLFITIALVLMNKKQPSKSILC